MDEDHPVDARRLTFTLATVFSFLSLAFFGGTEFKSLRTAAADSAKANERILKSLEGLPTREGVNVSVLSAVRPIDVALAELKGEVRALAVRVERMERAAQQEKK